MRQPLMRIAGCVLLAGCVTPTPPPPVATPADPHAEWAAVLKTFVDDAGRIDFAQLSVNPSALERYVAWLSVHDPFSAEKPDARLAGAINAYNALAMYNALRSGVAPKEKIRFFVLRKLKLGGREISLYDLENKRIRPLGEPRIHFALNCMVRDCPRLPREPFTAESLGWQLDRAAREFLNHERHVTVDAGERTAYLSAILKWYKQDFLLESDSLLAYVNRYRDVAIPLDYAVVFKPYDWTLNTKEQASIIESRR